MISLIRARVDADIRNVSIEINRVIAIILRRHRELPLADDQWDAYGADEIVMGPYLCIKARMARRRQAVGTPNDLLCERIIADVYGVEALVMRSLDKPCIVPLRSLNGGVACSS